MDNNENTFDFGIIQLLSPTKEADVDYSIENFLILITLNLTGFVILIGTNTP